MPSALLELPRNPVIDSNVLFDFLVWRFCIATKIRFPTCFNDNSAATDMIRALQWYFDRAKPIRTSPHVIAEIHGLAKARAEWAGPRLSEFWRFAHGELNRLSLDEHLVKLVKMRLDILEEFGPIDDSIFELATMTSAAVVTEDGRLRGRLSKEQIRVFRRDEIFAIWQEHTA
jgi:rRNA-processing protein FCF1